MTINLICDLDGVVYRGTKAIAGAEEALHRADRSGFHILFCTNNSSRTREQVARKIGEVAGYPALASQIVGSAEAAARLLAGSGLSAFVLGGEGVVEELGKVGIEVVAKEADAVVVGIDVHLTYERLRTAATLASKATRFVATNDDPTYPSEDGLWPGAGSILAAVEVASGRKAVVAGKPYQPMRDLLREKLIPGPVWVVGDRPDTDLALAAAEVDWKSILVLTGVVTDPDTADPQPDLVVKDLAAAIAVLDK